MVLLHRDGEKALPRSLATHEVPADVLSCSDNETTFGTVAETVATTWLSSLKSTVMLQDPFVFFISQIGELNGHGVAGSPHLSIFQDLMVATHLCNPSGN